MMDQLNKLFELVKSSLTALRDTDLGQVSYGSWGLAFGAGLFILVLFIYKIIRGRDKFRHLASGHRIPEGYNQSKSSRMIHVLPKVFLAGSVFFSLVAIANPYLPKAKIETTVESLEIVYLIDGSSSKCWEFKKTGKAAGEIARQAHLKFLDMRRGQNDRSALWIFSSLAYKIEDFIVDDDLFRMQVENAPICLVDPSHLSLPENDDNGLWLDVVAPRNKVRLIKNEGATDLIYGLRGVIKYFDEEGRKNLKRKALVIETDAAIEADPKAEFEELKKRKIVPYALFIEPNIAGERQWREYDVIETANDLKDRIKQYGGTVFDVGDRAGMDRAYREINRIEKAPVKLTRYLFRVLIFQRPLMVAIILGMVAVMFGLVLERDYP